MNIDKPRTQDNKLVWDVHGNGRRCIAELKIGQDYRSTEGAIYRLHDVVWHTGYVHVIRIVDGVINDFYTIWRIESLINRNMSLMETPAFVKSDWTFESSSGYDGWRNQKTGDWIYDEDFQKLKTPA